MIEDGTTRTDHPTEGAVVDGAEPGAPAPPGRPAIVRVLAILLTVAVVGAAAVVGARGLARTIAEILPGGDEIVTAPDVEPGIPVTVEIPAGASAREIGRILAEKGVVDSSVAFEVAVRRRGVGDRLIAGTYELVTGMGADGAIDVLLEGPVPDVFRITIPEGLWTDEILDLLAEETRFSREDLEEALLSGSVTSPLLPSDLPDGVTPLQAWEGLLFPATYDLFVDVSPAELLQKLADTMADRVDAVDWSVAESRGLTVYEGIIVASLVEAETRVDVDRPLVASVIYNRLDLGMPLQIDATVLYALGDRGRVLTLDDLEVDSPYNTYRISGLPPTPIGAPGEASLRAAAAPADTDYLYYVLTSTDGTHSFTADYDEFLRFKRQAKDDGVIP